MMQPTDTQADLTEPARALVTEMQDACGIYHASMIGRIAAFAAEARRADELRSLGWSVAIHNDYRLNGEARTFWLWTHPNGKWIKGEGRTDAEALSECWSIASPAPQDDLEGDVKHGNAEYFKAALAHAAAEARRAAIEECAALLRRAAEISDPGWPTQQKFKKMIAEMCALASPTPQEETR